MKVRVGEEEECYLGFGVGGGKAGDGVSAAAE